MELIGRVLWWSERDENGIILDSLGNEFYFDRSVIDIGSRSAIRRNKIVIFECNKSIKGCLCAFKVKLPAANRKSAIERKFRQQFDRGLDNEQ